MNENELLVRASEGFWGEVPAEGLIVEDRHTVEYLVQAGQKYRVTGFWNYAGVVSVSFFKMGVRVSGARVIPLYGDRQEKIFIVPRGVDSVTLTLSPQIGEKEARFFAVDLKLLGAGGPSDKAVLVTAPGPRVVFENHTIVKDVAPGDVWEIVGDWEEEGEVTVNFYNDHHSWPLSREEIVIERDGSGPRSAFIGRTRPHRALILYPRMVEVPDGATKMVVTCSLCPGEEEALFVGIKAVPWWKE